MRTIGIVGGIGAGKSTVVSLLTELKKCFVIGADEMGHRILLKGDLAYDKVIETFGREILDEEGNIVRRKLGAIVFGDQEKLKALNAITHPIIFNEIKTLLEQCKEQKKWDIVIIDAALLIEIGLIELTDYVIAVYADEKTRVERLMKRDEFTKEQVLERINKQKKWEELEKVADFVIDNRYTRQHTKEQMVKMLEQL
ncbi:dephospho-CoA kinase [Niameybacter massiliensis]|uniref:Dephospho-CoA kinase n=1 Tax=Holtiella tumoricola TaxID=3018743 RepID=A0AA42DS59_9FIRM|nr:MULTISPECIES: dephospho-CoA kinase [Lachnospirales]MDA3733689.1 dephospho-CoA kinase [Holtiella tumoricola]